MQVAHRGRARELLDSFFGVGFRQQTYLNVLYLTLAFPLGMAYLVVLSVGVSLGVGLAVLVVGIPILGAVIALSLGLGSLERVLANYLLGTDLSGQSLPADASVRARVSTLATDLGTWKTVVYLPSKFVIGVASFVVVTTGLTTGFSMLLVPLYYDQPGLYVGVVTDRPVELHPTLYVAWNKLLVGFEAVVTLDAWRVDTLADAVLVAALGALLLVLSLHALNVFARLSKWWTRRMLDDAYSFTGGDGGDGTPQGA
jgi:hypothetical protein